MTIINTFIPKIGTPELYIGKPLTENNNVVGTIIGCEERGDQYFLTIDTKLSFNINENIPYSFSIKEV